MFVEEIPLKLKIGLFPEERDQIQIVLCSIYLNVKPTYVASDDIEDTVNYFELTKAIQMHAEKQTYKLLEPLAHSLLDIILEFEHVQSAKIKLVKPKIMSALGAKACGIEVERSIAK